MLPYFVLDFFSIFVNRQRILKKEVDNLSNTNFKELEQLRVENELFASQIIETEVENREIKAVIEYLNDENRQLSEDLESVQGNRQVRVEESPSELASQVESLAQRLAEVEKDREEDIESLKQMILDAYTSEADESEEPVDEQAQKDKSLNNSKEDEGPWSFLCDCSCFPSVSTEG